jgi:hypothetical protein
LGQGWGISQDIGRTSQSSWSSRPALRQYWDTSGCCCQSPHMTV